MSSLIQVVAKQATLTFKRCFTDPLFHENLDKLRVLVSRVTADDVKFNAALVSDKTLYDPIRKKNVAPVTYVHLFEDEIYSMGIFVLKNGTSLPLHDHPDMFGVCKCIHGTLHLNSFSYLKQEPLHPQLKQNLKPWQEVRAVQEVFDGFKTVKDSAYFLSPEEANVHSIQAVNGPAAFLDVLAPPYDHKPGGRDCHYYCELPLNDVNSNESTTKDVKWLLQTSQPYDFWCDSAPYEGPVIT